MKATFFGVFALCLIVCLSATSAAPVDPSEDASNGSQPIIPLPKPVAAGKAEPEPEPEPKTTVDPETLPISVKSGSASLTWLPEADRRIVDLNCEVKTGGLQPCRLTHLLRRLDKVCPKIRDDEIKVLEDTIEGIAGNMKAIDDIIKQGEESQNLKEDISQIWKDFRGPSVSVLPDDTHLNVVNISVPGELSAEEIEEEKEEKAVEVEKEEDKKATEAEEIEEGKEEKAVEVEKEEDKKATEAEEIEEEKEEKAVEVEKEEDKKVVEAEEVKEEKAVEVEKEEDKKAAEAEEKEESELGKVDPKGDPISIPEPESDEPVEKKTNVDAPVALPENDAGSATAQPSPAAAVTTDAPKRGTKSPKKPKKKPRRKPKRPRKKGTKAPKKVTTAAPKVVTTTTPKVVTTTTPKVVTTTTPKVVTTTTPKIVTTTTPKIITTTTPRRIITTTEEPCVDVFSVEEKRYQCKGYWKRGLTILGLQINKLKKENHELFLKVIDANGKIKLAQESIAEHKINVKALKKKFAWPDKENIGNTHKDCSDAFKKDHKKPGVYLIHPVGSPYKVHLLCVDGWTVIQRRFDGSENFHRSFDEYLSGFGNFSGEFFVGLENLHRMTLSQSYTLRVDVKSAAGKWYFGVFNNFAVSDETDQFRLKLGNMTASNTDDVMDQSRDKPFSTYDRDNDDWSGGNCAQHFRGGWWSAPSSIPSPRSISDWPEEGENAFEVRLYFCSVFLLVFVLGLNDTAVVTGDGNVVALEGSISSVAFVVHASTVGVVVVAVVGASSGAATSVTAIAYRCCSCCDC
ncbi:Hypothetical predicted protein [Octopus vulgaris]|uniref:Fibrinogen C-terminal domain-containing protein n=1 Tax=Octopus vulgaris TaxID=6645 RepID=A0AA36ANL4_OCTVU|nr:Hypothetical predicted protein [Octopus vulgaris]